MDRRTAKAVVHLTIEVEVGAWGPDCTIGQADKQAREGAIGMVSAALRHGRTDFEKVFRIVKTETAEVALVRKESA